MLKSLNPCEVCHPVTDHGLIHAQFTNIIIVFDKLIAHGVQELSAFRVDHKAVHSRRSQASENPVDRSRIFIIIFGLYGDDQGPVFARRPLFHPDAVLLKFSSRDLILESTVGYAGDSLQKAPEISAGDRMIRVFLPQFHIDVVRTGSDLPAFRIKEYDILRSYDLVDRLQVFFVVEQRILLDQLRCAPCVFQIKGSS